MHRGVKIYSPEYIFFVLFWSIGFQFMADRVIFDIGWVVDKACILTMKGQLEGFNVIDDL